MHTGERPKLHLAFERDIIIIHALNDQSLKTISESDIMYLIRGKNISNGCKALVQIEYCKNLESVKLPKYLNFTGLSFMGCTKLKEASIPVCSQIDNRSFSGCNNLEKVSIVCKFIPAVAFFGLEKLQTVEVGNELEIIGQEAFKNCKNLKYFTAAGNKPCGQAIKEIEQNAFENCKELIGNFSFETKKANINNGAFKNCIKLNNIQFKTFAWLGNNAFSGCQSLPENIFSVDQSNRAKFSRALPAAFKGSNLESKALEWSKEWQSDSPTKIVPETKFKTLFDSQWTKTHDPLFPAKNGLPSPADIHQGVTGDCWLLAILANLAASNPRELKKCFEEDGDYVFVKLYRAKLNYDTKNKIYETIVSSPVKVKVERSVLLNPTFETKYSETLGKNVDRFFDRHALWVRIMEKAITTYLKKYPTMQDHKFDSDDLMEILHGSSYKGYYLFSNNQLMPSYIASAIIGKRLKIKCTAPLTEDQLFEYINKRIQKKQYMQMSIRRDNPLELPNPHAYALMGALKGNKQQITSINILPNFNSYRKVLNYIYNLGKEKFKDTEEKMFFILHNPHGDNGIMTIPVGKDQWDGINLEEMKNKNELDNEGLAHLKNANGICIVDIKYFQKYFANMHDRAGNS